MTKQDRMCLWYRQQQLIDMLRQEQESQGASLFAQTQGAQSQKAEAAQKVDVEVIAPPNFSYCLGTPHWRTHKLLRYHEIKNKTSHL